MTPMTPIRRLSIGLCALSFAAVACKSEKPRTEIMLGVATDLDAPAPLNKVLMNIERLSDGLPIGQQEFLIPGTPSGVFELPGTYGVYSEGGNPDRFRVTLTGIDNRGATLIVRKAVLTLVPRRTLFVRLGVVTACIGKLDCPDGDTCIEGRCASEVIDSSRLPDYQPGMEMTLACASPNAQYRNTATKQLLPVASAGGCDSGGVCSEGVCHGPTAGAFSPTNGDMTTARSASLQIGGPLLTLADGRVLLVGGVGPNSQPVLASAEIYDPATGRFTATAGSMATARTYFAAARLQDGRVLIAGGINESATALASAEIFDPDTGMFTPTPSPMTVARTFPSAATLADGRVLIVGGLNQIQSYALGQVSYFGGLDSAEIFDPVARTFTPVTNVLVESRAFSTVIPLENGDAVVMCGNVQAGPRATLERFSGATRTFAATATPLPGGAASCHLNQAGLLADGRILVTTPPNMSWLFDPAMATWTFSNTNLHPVLPAASVQVPLADGKALFLGTTAEGAITGREAYLFDPETRGFAFTVGRLGRPRSPAMTALLHTGDVLIAGGSGDATAEIFHR
jgi:hypothetical protein